MKIIDDGQKISIYSKICWEMGKKVFSKETKKNLEMVKFLDLKKLKKVLFKGFDFFEKYSKELFFTTKNEKELFFQVSKRQ